MLKLDHITVIAPTLAEGVRHVRNCLDLDVPFGTCHDYMGTHNHRLQLGNNVYLEIVALNPDGIAPGRARWFGLDDQDRIRSDWEDGRRLRGWVAATESIDALVSTHGAIFGEKVLLPTGNPTFAFAIPANGSLPLDGGVPSIIDHQDDPTSMADIPDFGACLLSMILEHPDPASIEALYCELSIDRPPVVVRGADVRYRAQIETPTGLKELN
ncbi:VOC family protein [Thalassospira alkalitolerans]|uniref:VOC family protein n=1 Tax=Thalassospira alkalitolerans TaxID=1293890 RepID=UPI003AA872D2